jgi:hypothetical protein
MRKLALIKEFGFGLTIMILVLAGIPACDFLPGDFLPGQPEKVEFLDQSFAVEKPASWSLRSDLNDVADLQMGNPFKEAYAIIISENKMDFDEMTLQDHSDLTRSMIGQNLKNYHESDQEVLYIGGHQALRYRLTGSMDGLNIVYWHVTIETENYYHQMLLWSLKSKFGQNEADFDSVIQSFEEI